MTLNLTSPAVLDLPLPDFTGARLRLRGLEPADAPRLARFAGDRRVAAGTRSIPHPLPEGAAAAFIAATLRPTRDEDVWAIEALAQPPAAQPPAASATPSPVAAATAGGLVGVISLKPLDRGQSQIGYWVAPEFWNAGLASEAVRLLVAANPHGARTLFAEAFQDNPASARILTQAGFDFIGDAEAISAARGGITVPTWTYLRRMG